VITEFASGKEAKSAKGIELSVGTRQKRRKEVQKLILHTTEIMNAEMRFMENMPERLHSGPMYELAEQTVSALEEALEILSEAYE
jgi:hypothetical protein